MALLTTLKLVSAKRSNNASPIMQRRNKLLKQLAQQHALATAQANGSTYAPTKFKQQVDAETGESSTVQVAKRIKQWWWLGDNGKLQFAVRYGAKVLALGKGTNAIEIADAAQLISTIELVKQAVEAGELDAAMTEAGKSARANFK